jgi:hypothetical protein
LNSEIKLSNKKNDEDNEEAADIIPDEENNAENILQSMVPRNQF